MYAVVWRRREGGRVGKRRLVANAHERYLFHLAERLGMTVGRLLAEMSSAELFLWMAHDTLTQKEREKAERLQSKDMQQKRPRRG